jgi:hypothetical protein
MESDMQAAPVETIRGIGPGPLSLSLAGLAAGVAAAAVVQACMPFFEVPAELHPTGMPDPVAIAKFDKAKFRIDCLNGATVGAIYGGLAGALLGFVATRRAKPTGRAVGTGLLAALAAAHVGTLAGYLMPYVRASFGEATVETDLWFTVAVQAFFLGAVGVTIGVALALTARGSGTFGQRTVGGLLGGLLGGAVYPIVAAFLFADANTEGAVPREAALQYLWLGAAGLLTGLCLAGSSRPVTRPPVEPPAA